MSAIQNLAQRRPYVFAVGLFIVETAVALPFVVAFRVFGLDLVPLRLIIPVAQSAFMIWVIWTLGWFARAGFTRTVKDIHVYWYPVLVAFVPVLLYGTIRIDAGPLLFYAAALLFTGVSEEALARGVILPALMPRGKWLALFLAATLFGVGHFTNLFFEDFSLLEMTETLAATFGFAVLYGAVFLRTGNIWPLIVLHALDDYLILTSGTAGPFTVQRMPELGGIALALVSTAYGVFIARKAEWGEVDAPAAVGDGSP